MHELIIRSHKSIVRAAGLATAALLIAGAAQAQGKSHEHGESGDHGHKGKDKGAVVERRNGEVVAVPNRDVVVQRRVPPGLAKKPGMMPPGQYKKLYTTSQGADVLSGIFRNNGYTVTRVVPYGTSRYVYYRSHNGREHRAIIRPGTDRLSFVNVPSSLLSQVLSRLY
jgi:hypothetical protein